MNGVTGFWTHLRGHHGGRRIKGGGSETGGREDFARNLLVMGHRPHGRSWEDPVDQLLTSASFSLAMVDVIFADVAQPDQTRIVALNAHTFLRNGGHFVISIKANCIDSTASAEAVFASEVKKMQQENMKPQEQLTLEPYERDHAVVVGVYR